MIGKLTEDRIVKHNFSREQLLETKLAVLQRLVCQTGDASSNAWKSLIDEDRLLTRVEILESQLSVYGKGMSEDKLRDECQRLVEEKESYQVMAKETLKRLTDEKVESAKKVNKPKRKWKEINYFNLCFLHFQVGELQTLLNSTDDEFNLVKELHAKTLDENQELIKQLTELNRELDELRDKNEELTAKESVKTEAEASSMIMEESLVASQEAASSEAEGQPDEVEEEKKFSEIGTQTEEEDEKEEEKVEFESKLADLREKLAKKEEEMEALRKKKNASCSSPLESDEDKNAKLVQLLKVKEKYEEVAAANEKLKSELKQVSAEVATLEKQSLSTTTLAFVLLPLMFLILAILYSYFS